METDLIYDVGMHNGDDTAYYLRRGFRVIAIEANPEQVEAGRKRFATEIADGRVKIVEVAIGPRHGHTSFWISSNSEYSSFDRRNAEKWNNTAREVSVVCQPMTELLSQFGVPYYMKIDIEGADQFCLEAVDPNDPPMFLSFEKSKLEMLLLARTLGFSRFKLIAQEDFRQLNYRPLMNNRVTRRLGRWRNRFLGDQWSAQMADGAHAYGSSGPFGEMTHGPWRSMEEVAFAWLAFDLGHTGDPNPTKSDWFDVHCAR